MKPSKIGPRSNGEFVPPRATDIERETVRRTLAAAEDLSRRLGMPRRRFLASLGGSALTMLTLNACAREANEAAPTPSPGPTATPSSTPTPTSAPGGAFEVPPTATTEPDVAAEALAGEEFIFDVQGHLLEYELTPDTPWDGSPFVGQTFPQAECGEGDPRARSTIEQFLDLFFLQSDTSVAVLSAIPILAEPNPLSPEVMAWARRVADSLCDEGRIMAHGQAMPNVGDPAAHGDRMQQLVDSYDIAAWKAYTHLPGPLAFFLDDHDPLAAPVGRQFVRDVAEVGPPILCVHKGLRGTGGGAGRFADPVDIGPAAASNPDVSFVVYHSGFEADGPEGPYTAETAGQGVNRLITSVADAGIGPDGNVYAELGSTWRFIMTRPDAAAHVIGKLLVAFGEDRVVWGTDCVWYGSPQDQIEAFRAFQISEEFQELFGYPALTDEVKRKILGLNSAALYGIEPVHQPCEFTRDELQAAREALAPIG